MRHGAKARLILPSHLAYGSIGDGADIPGFATLVYNIEIIE
ncbi:MAG: FKBP-type peptidyl-prolyl cis-trans isomerase [Bacteroidales bacterium]|nr:FKBP-type peptidyl-prolyl cis-trans isomerase [Bacteroidales bacterium]